MNEFKIKINPAIAGLKESSTLAINQKAKQLRKQGKELYHFGFGQSPFPVHKKIQQALIQHAGEKDYLPTAGLLELRVQIARYLKEKQNSELCDELILIGPGSKELIFQSLYVLEGTVIIPAPSWVSYKPQVDIKREKTIIYQTKETDNYKVTADRFRTFCKTLPEGQKVIIMNSPSNPTGVMYSDKEVQSLCEVLREYKIICISDEIYSEINFTNRPYTSFAKYYPEATIITGGLSKVFSAGGYRLGFIALPRTMEEMFSPLKAMFSETFSSVSAPIQYAALTAYCGDSEVMDEIEKCSLIHRFTSLYLYERFQKMNLTCPRPEGAFYLFINFENYRKKLEKKGLDTSEKIASYLLENFHIALLPGTDFYMPEKSLCFRVATVDYDGDKALKEFTVTNDSFIEDCCPLLKKGCDALEGFLRVL